MSRFGYILSLVVLGAWALGPSMGPAKAASPSQAADTTAARPVAALQTLGEDGQMRIGDQDRCPLCGMFPAKRPKTAAAMVLADGRTFYFCANGCLLRAWRDPVTHLNAPRETIQRVVTRDFFSGAPLDAHQAWWVAGSDVVGPMGPALVALSSEADVGQFKARHGGKIVFQLSRMDDTLWRKLFPPKKS